MVFGLAAELRSSSFGLLLTPSPAERRSQLDLVGALYVYFESGLCFAKAIKSVSSEVGF